MQKLVEELREEFDYILLDCPAGIEQGFKMQLQEQTVHWLLPHRRYLQSVMQTVSLVSLEANEIKKIELIVNRLRMDMVKRGDMMSIEDVHEILAIDLIGAVPDDEQIVISTNQGEPLVGSDSLAGQAYLNICKRIMGEEVPLLT